MYHHPFPLTARVNLEILIDFNIDITRRAGKRQKYESNVKNLNIAVYQCK